LPLFLFILSFTVTYIHNYIRTIHSSISIHRGLSWYIAGEFFSQSRVSHSFLFTTHVFIAEPDISLHRLRKSYSAVKANRIESQFSVPRGVEGLWRSLGIVGVFSYIRHVGNFFCHVPHVRKSFVSPPDFFRSGSTGSKTMAGPWIRRTSSLLKPAFN
jgi:hypothetical protein